MAAAAGAGVAAFELDALDELSKQMVVDVDNAVRTSESELQLAVEEFGAERTKPFADAVANAKAALAQAFSVRQTLDDASPEPPLEQRRLLTSVVVAAGKADQQLESQNKAFHELRDLVINAPDRLDGLTQQMVALSARLDPTAQTLAGLHQQFSDTALSSVSGNVDTARQRLTFADGQFDQNAGCNEVGVETLDLDICRHTTTFDLRIDFHQFALKLFACGLDADRRALREFMCVAFRDREPQEEAAAGDGCN